MEKHFHLEKGTNKNKNKKSAAKWNGKKGHLSEHRLFSAGRDRLHGIKPKYLPASPHLH